MGAGIALSSLVAVFAARFGGTPIAGLLLLALFASAAFALQARLEGNWRLPSVVALASGAACLAAGLFASPPGPAFIPNLIPFAGAAFWLAFLTDGRPLCGVQR